MNLYRNTLVDPFTKYGRSTRLKYSTPAPGGSFAFNASLSNTRLYTAASPSNLFLNAGPLFSSSSSVISHQFVYGILIGKP